MEDRLVGADIHHHFSITRIEHLKKGKNQMQKLLQLYGIVNGTRKKLAN